jgi:hypothetical protein
MTNTKGEMNMEIKEIKIDKQESLDYIKHLMKMEIEILRAMGVPKAYIEIDLHSHMKQVLKETK